MNDMTINVELLYELLFNVELLYELLCNMELLYELWHELHLGNLRELGYTVSSVLF